MLVIKTIKLTGESVIKPKKISKVRVGYDEHVCSNKKPPRFFQNQTIQWKQDMTLPLFFRKTIEFQFCPNHQFGYNPEEMSSICYAQARVQNFRKPYMETNAVDSNGNIVGKVYFQFSVINDHKTKIEIEIQTKVVISSMLAHINTFQGQKGQLQVVVDDQNLCTPQIKIEAGQLTWVEKQVINVFHQLSDQKQILVRVYIQDNFTGEASIPVKQIRKNAQKYKKAFIYDNKKKKLGILFIDIKVKNIKQKDNIKSQISQNKSNVKNADYFPPLTPIKKIDQDQKIRSSKSERKIAPATSKQSFQSNLVYSRVKTKPQTNAILAAKLGEYNKETKQKFKL